MVSSYIENRTAVIRDLPFAEADFDALVKREKPYILKGALNHLALVQLAKASSDKLISHLLSFSNNNQWLYYSGKDSKKRFFYDDEMKGLNFTSHHSSLSDFFESIRADKEAKKGESFYIGSADLENHLPGFLNASNLQLEAGIFEKYPSRAGIWIGNQTIASAHFDVSNNVAACIAGKRRFTLFPPEQIKNLYPGPLEPTPGGQVVSMFDPNRPDFEKYPKAKTAMAYAEIAELDVGDVIVYPAMWWHQVEALDEFNVMINYWWNAVPSFIDDPMNALLQGFLSLKDRPDYEKKAWRELFDFYIFGDQPDRCEHLPEHAQGPLAPMTELTARRLRAKLLKKLNR